MVLTAPWHLGSAQSPEDISRGLCSKGLCVQMPALTWMLDAFSFLGEGEPLSWPRRSEHLSSSVDGHVFCLASLCLEMKEEIQVPVTKSICPRFISSPSLRSHSEWFLSSQLLFLWSKCLRQWAPGGEHKHFWLSLKLPSCGVFEESVAQSPPIRWAWPGCRRVSKGLVSGDGGLPWDTGGSFWPPPGGVQSCLCPSLSSLSHSVHSIALFSPMNSMQKIHEQDFSLQKIK